MKTVEEWMWKERSRGAAQSVNEEDIGDIPNTKNSISSTQIINLSPTKDDIYIHQRCPWIPRETQSLP